MKLWSCQEVIISQYKKTYLAHKSNGIGACCFAKCTKHRPHQNLYPHQRYTFDNTDKNNVTGNKQAVTDDNCVIQVTL